MFGCRNARASPAPAQPAASAAETLKIPAEASEAAATQSADINSSAPGSGSSPEESKRQAAVVTGQLLAFAQIVSVFMRSPLHKRYALADLEWLVLPPLLMGQFSIAEASAQLDGPKIPVAVVLWASVSPVVDKRLSDELNPPVRLRPDEWRSGDILWLMDAIGDERVLPQFLKQLRQTIFKNRSIKLHRLCPNGKMEVLQLFALADPSSGSPNTVRRN